MIPLTAEEWIDSLPPAQQGTNPEDDDIFHNSPSQLKRRVVPNNNKSSFVLAGLFGGKSSNSQLTGANLGKLPNTQVRTLIGSKAVTGDQDEVATEAGDIGESRKMGGFEQFFSTMVPYGLGLIYYIVDMDGPADANLLREAMRIQVKRHPNLRSRIVGDNFESVPFDECPDFRIPYVESEDVIAYTEKLMTDSTVLKSGRELYLWSLAIHHTPSSNKNQIVLLIHHAISDGDSILRLLQALVDNMGKLAYLPGPARRQILRETECLKQLPSADVQLYPKYNGYYIIYHFRSLFRELWRIILQPAIPRYFAYTRSHNERSTRISSFTLDAPDFKRLLGACKANGTSVTGALTAACCQTMEKFIDRKYKYRLKAEILVNFRGKCTAEGSQDAHQLYAAPMDVMLHGGGTPETALNFWETAKKVKQDIEDFVAQPHMIVDTLDFFYTLGHHPISVPLFRLFGASWKQGRLKAVSISNLGLTDKLFQQVGPYKLGRMQMGIDELLFGHSVFLAVASHEGRLNFTLSCVDPIFTKSMAEQYGQGVVRSLIDACPPPETPSPQQAVAPTGAGAAGGKGDAQAPRPPVAGS